MDPLSPGYEAGLRRGDVMLSVDAKPTDARFEEDLPPVRKLIADIPVGKQVVVRVARGDQELDIPVTTAERSLLRGNQVEFPEWGFTAVDLTENIVRQAQLPAKKGILVTGAQVGGIAANAHLQHSDIILKVDEAEVKDLASFQNLYRGLVESKKRLVMLEVKRGALTRFVLVKQDGAEAGAPSEPDATENEGGPKHVE
jgi:S1-C subfamily serine protease